LPQPKGAAARSAIKIFRRIRKEINMKKLSLTLLASLLSLSVSAFAQSAASGDITESTDPSKAAAVEQRAQELASQQQQNAAMAAETKSEANKPQKRRAAKSMAKAGKSADSASGAGDTASQGSSSK
jgi:ADP-dependent phosphofructokinase/glucokinase